MLERDPDGGFLLLLLVLEVAPGMFDEQDHRNAAGSRNRLSAGSDVRISIATEAVGKKACNQAAV